MRHRKIALLLLAALGTAASAQPPRPLAIVNANVIDMRSPRSYNATLLIRDGRIEHLASPDASVPSGYEKFDATGMWVIPGLWDMHTHIWDRVLLFPIYLAHGITSVRDMGSTLTRWSAWRDSVSRGVLDGPRGIFSGVIVDGIAPYSPFFVHVATPDSGRSIVRSLKERGADFIKVYDRLSRDTYLAIADEAKKQRIPIAGHLPPALTVRDAIAAQQRSIEHISSFSLDCSAASDSLRRHATSALDSVRHLDFARDTSLRGRVSPSIGIFYRNSHDVAFERCDPARGMPPIARALREAGTWVTPTLVLGGSVLLNDVATEDSIRTRLPAWVVGMTRTNAAQDSSARQRANKRVVMLSELRRAGVRMLIGSDAPNPGSVPGVALHRELELFVRAGYTPYEALRMATHDAAEFAGVSDSLGSIAAGQLADLVLLGGNPLSDIRKTRDIRAVLLQGRLLGSDTLNARLPKPQTPR